MFWSRYIGKMLPMPRICQDIVAIKNIANHLKKGIRYLYEQQHWLEPVICAQNNGSLKGWVADDTQLKMPEFKARSYSYSVCHRFMDMAQNNKGDRVFYLYNFLIETISCLLLSAFKTTFSFTWSVWGNTVTKFSQVSQNQSITAVIILLC